MSLELIIVFFVLGIVVGSFLNVVICRYQPNFFLLSKEIIGGRSHCLSCGSKLSWFELIPLISFLIQGGKCRHCHSRLLWQYPLVELISGLIFVGVPYYFFSFVSPAKSITELDFALIIGWILIFLIWLLIFFIDLRWLVIPNELNLAIFLIGIFITLILNFGNFSDNSISPFFGSFISPYDLIFPFFTEKVIIKHLYGAFFGGVVFGLIFLLGRGRALGLGDVKLALVSGLVFGWPDIFLAVILSFLLGGLIAFILLIFRKKRFGDKIPFGPVFVIALIITVFFGEKIIATYFKIFSLPFN